MRTLILFLLFSLALPSLAIPASKLVLNQPVIDQAQMLSPAEEAALSAKLKNWHQQKLMQAAVVLVNETDGAPIFDYAMAIADRWQLGDKDADNGLLLVIDKNKRDYFVLTGDGLEGALPDILVKKIGREKLVPAFRQGRFSVGIEQSLQAFAEQLGADPESQQRVIQASYPSPSRQLQGNNPSPASSPHPAFLIWVIWAMALGMAILRKAFGTLIASLAVSAIAFVAAFYMMKLTLLISLFFAGVTFFIAISASSRRGGSSISVSTGGRSSSSSSRRSSRRSSRSSGGYRGGGGGFSGGGAGGSW